MSGQGLENEFDKLQNSIEISKKRISQSLHQSKLQEISRNVGSRGFTMPLYDNSESSHSQRQRLMTAHLLKDLIPMEQEQQSNLIQKVNASSRVKNFDGKILLLGTEPHRLLGFYLKTMEECELSRVHESNEILIQNALVAGKYINNYGLFFLLKEILAKKGIKTTITQDQEADADTFLTSKSQKSTPIRRTLGLLDLHYLVGGVSLTKFRLYQKIDASRFKHYFEQIQELRSKIEKAIRLPPLFLALYDNYIDFTIPDLQDNQINSFASEMRNMSYELDSLPLISHLNLRLSDLNPWQNREINKEWKLFALQSEDKTIGFMEFDCAKLHQEIPRAKTLHFKLYGESHYYQLLVRIGVNSATGLLIKDCNM